MQEARKVFGCCCRTTTGLGRRRRDAHARAAPPARPLSPGTYRLYDEALRQAAVHRPALGRSAYHLSIRKDQKESRQGFVRSGPAASRRNSTWRSFCPIRSRRPWSAKWPTFRASSDMTATAGGFCSRTSSCRERKRANSFPRRSSNITWAWLITSAARKATSSSNYSSPIPSGVRPAISWSVRRCRAIWSGRPPREKRP